jgi:hypothetical protein
MSQLTAVPGCPNINQMGDTNVRRNSDAVRLAADHLGAAPMTPAAAIPTLALAAAKAEIKEDLKRRVGASALRTIELRDIGRLARAALAEPTRGRRVAEITGSATCAKWLCCSNLLVA